MFQSKLSTIRLGASNIISSSNRLQLAIQASTTESMMTAATITYCPRRYQHVMIAPAKPKSYYHFSINAKNARQFSIETIKHACMSRSNTKVQGLRSNLRPIRIHEISENMKLLTEQKRCIEKDENTLRLKTELDKPLVVMLPWLMAKQNHIRKYAQLYIDHGFDVMTVSVTPWQVMWPKKGIQLVAADVVKFLENNVNKKNPLLLHGFSVGGYLWAECMVHMSREVDRYRHVLDMVQGQVWDSAVELTEIPIGVPKAVFPNNDTLQLALKKYLKYHMRTFHEPATSHYIRASQMFQSTLVKKPALLLVSNGDPIGSVAANKELRKSWQKLGIRVEWKCWDESVHVAHFQKYREDYINVLFDFLQSINMIQKEKEALRVRI